MESFLVKCLNCQDYLTELHFLGTNYGDDVNVGTLTVQVEIFKVLMKDGEFFSAAGERSFSSARRMKT